MGAGEGYGASVLGLCWLVFCCWRLLDGSWAAGRPSAGQRLSRVRFCWGLLRWRFSRQSWPKRPPAHFNSAARTALGAMDADAVRRYQAQGRPVFVDFTASWCLSCQVNERVALQQPRCAGLSPKNVALLKADWTRHDDAITQALTGLGRSGVPAYALYAPGQTSRVCCLRFRRRESSSKQSGKRARSADSEICRAVFPDFSQTPS